jgi:hypothetical protein
LAGSIHARGRQHHNQQRAGSREQGVRELEFSAPCSSHSALKPPRHESIARPASSGGNDGPRCQLALNIPTAVAGPRHLVPWRWVLQLMGCHTSR